MRILYYINSSVLANAVWYDDFTPAYTSITTTANMINPIDKTPDFLTVDYQRLVEVDAAHLKLLRTACERDGFFYLDLSQQDTLLGDVQKAMGIAQRFFELDEEKKLEYDIDLIGPWKLSGCVCTKLFFFILSHASGVKANLEIVIPLAGAMLGWLVIKSMDQKVTQ